jgi:hypothetical protein
VRYFKSNFAGAAEEMAFEKKLFDKTARTNAKSEAEIIILDGLVTVYRNSSDVWLYIVGSQTENELVLVNVLSALLEALTSLLRCPPDKRALLDNFDTLLLCIDEMVRGPPPSARESRRARAQGGAPTPPPARPARSTRAPAAPSLGDGPACARGVCRPSQLDAGMILETDASAIVNRVGMKAAEGGVPAGADTFSEGNFNSFFASAREQVAKAMLK